MTDEKQKPEEGEVSDEQLQGVAGGATSPKDQQPISQTKPLDMDTPDLANFVCDKTIPTAELLDPFARTDDED